jgi:hypothetical protein
VLCAVCCVLCAVCCVLCCAVGQPWMPGAAGLGPRHDAPPQATRASPRPCTPATTRRRAPGHHHGDAGMQPLQGPQCLITLAGGLGDLDGARREPPCAQGPRGPTGPTPGTRRVHRRGSVSPYPNGDPATRATEVLWWQWCTRTPTPTSPPPIPAHWCTPACSSMTTNKRFLESAFDGGGKGRGGSGNTLPPLCCLARLSSGRRPRYASTAVSPWQSPAQA